jgi:hypothetical protein
VKPGPLLQDPFLVQLVDFARMSLMDRPILRKPETLQGQ